MTNNFVCQTKVTLGQNLNICIFILNVVFIVPTKFIGADSLSPGGRVLFTLFDPVRLLGDLELAGDDHVDVVPVDVCHEIFNLFIFMIGTIKTEEKAKVVSDGLGLT